MKMDINTMHAITSIQTVAAKQQDVHNQYYPTLIA